MKFREDFPIFKNNPGLVYLDSASTSQKPKVMIDTMKKFQENNYANVQRALYNLSLTASKIVDKTRSLIAEQINSTNEEIVFTKSTTESINLLSYTIPKIIPNGKNEIVLSVLEHHSNMIPWQVLAKRSNMKIKYIKLKKDFSLDYKNARELINNKTAIVSLCLISNVTGTLNNLKKISSLAKKFNSYFIVDAAQGFGHIEIDAKKIGCDFLAFSAHKSFGPTGLGILYGKKEILDKLPPFLFGGGMISSANFKEFLGKKPPQKFEAGTLPITEIVGFSSSLSYIRKIKIKEIEKKIKSLTKYALKKLKNVKGIKLYSPKNPHGIISFNLNNIHPHDVASLLNDDNIAVRAGHHCAMPLMNYLRIPGTVRVSLQIYNTKEDIDKLVNSLNKITKIFL